MLYTSIFRLICPGQNIPCMSRRQLRSKTRQHWMDWKHHLPDLNPKRITCRLALTMSSTASSLLRHPFHIPTKSICIAANPDRQGILWCQIWTRAILNNCLRWRFPINQLIHLIEKISFAHAVDDIRIWKAHNKITIHWSKIWMISSANFAMLSAVHES